MGTSPLKVLEFTSTKVEWLSVMWGGTTVMTAHLFFCTSKFRSRNH